MTPRNLAFVLLVAALAGPACSSGNKTVGGCRSDLDCGEGTTCSVTQQCVATGECSADTDCGRGEACEAQRCVETSECSADRPCPGGARCSAIETCLQPGACSADSDCEVGERCSSRGECILDGECLQRDDCGAGLVCNAEQSCVPGSDCGAEEIPTTRVTPNMLVVLDRSCSMRSRVDGQRKWELAVDAINRTLSIYRGQVRWGLTLFPDTERPACEQGDIPIPVGDDNETPIQELLEGALKTAHDLWPDGPCVTNIDTAMLQASFETAFRDPVRESYVLLATDGRQSGCVKGGGDDGTEMIIRDLLLKDNVRTFVLGFGDGVDEKQLERFATEGGTARATVPAFYQAENGADLEAALAEIASQVVSCSVLLEQRPDDPSNIYVFFNDADRVAPDSENGWSYDTRTQVVAFHGSACQRLRSGDVTDVDVVFGCDGPVIR